MHSRDYDYNSFKSGSSSSSSYRLSASSNSEHHHIRNQPNRNRHYFDYDYPINSNNSNNNGRYNNNQRKNYSDMNYSSRRDSRDISRNMRDYDYDYESKPRVVPPLTSSASSQREQNLDSRNYEHSRIVRNIRNTVSSRNNFKNNVTEMDEISDDDISEGEVKEKEEGEIEDDDDDYQEIPRKVYSKIVGTSNCSSPGPSFSLRQHITMDGKIFYAFIKFFKYV